MTEYQFLFHKNLPANHLDFYVFNECLEKTFIDDVCTRLASKPLENATTVKNNDGESQVDTKKRRTKVFWLPKTDEFFDVYRTIIEMVAQCNNAFYRFHLTGIYEMIQYTVYTGEDQGFYGWHVDMTPTGNRKLSLVCQLSDPSEYDGGQLQINNGKIIDIEKKKGHVVIFPSYMLHRVTPVTRGVRKTLVVWIDGPPFT